MGALTGIVSTLTLIAGLTGASVSGRLRSPSRLSPTLGWVLVGLSTLLAVTVAFPTSLTTGGPDDFTQPSGSACVQGCPGANSTSTDIPALPSGDTLGAAGLVSVPTQ